MKILKIKQTKPIIESIKNGDNYKIWLNPNMDNKMTGKSRPFRIVKLNPTRAK